jgi:hypothetical protein
MVFDTLGNTTAGGTVAMASSFKRNRIINGNMLINQRAATITSGGYCTDRWLVSNLTTGAWTCAQSSTAPTGFTNSLLFTKTTGGTPSSGDVNYIEQVIEGLNCYDLAWGTANAKTVTLSFWVYAGATGTFGGSLRNGGATRSYPFTYTISASNTWTNISVTIAGDTTGTWATDNTAGICVFFDIGSGTTYRATAGAWAAGNYVGATGATTYPSSTSGGTFYITGVQLEVGTKATPYEMQIYSDQLAQCQRYLPAFPIGASSRLPAYGVASNTTTFYVTVFFPVPARTAPTGLTASSAGHFQVGADGTVGAVTLSSVSINGPASQNASRILCTTGSATTASVGQAVQIDGTSASANIYFTGCEL